MKYSHNNIIIIDAPESTFDKIIEVLVIVLLSFMPLAFGVVQAWSEEVVIILATAISVCFLLKLIIEKNASITWSWAYLPLILFIAIAVFQLIPLPASFVKIFSPNTAATKQQLLGDLPNSAALLESMTLTFYSNSTKHDLRLIIAAAAVFVVILNIYRRPDQIKRLLGSIAIIGGSIAILALAQDLCGNGKIYWFVPTFSGKADSAAFINHSHYAQFMNLSIGAALALMMVKLNEAFTRNKITPSFVLEYLSSPEAKIVWLLLVMIIIGAASVFISLSRGGMVSMLIAAGFTTLILSSRQSIRGRGWIMVLLALGAFICVLYVGFDAVYDRLATLSDINDAQSGRWQIVKDIATAWTKFPVFGTGLGTHEVVYPMFDRATTVAIASHAENEYAQAAEETGLIGLIALVAFGILVWFNYSRNAKGGLYPVLSAAYGLGFGLLAIMIHSFSDFGQHLPANAFLTIISCALLISLARMNRPIADIRPATSSRGLPVISLLFVTVALSWSIYGADNARKAEESWKTVDSVERRISEQKSRITEQDYRDLISSAARAVDYQPDNIKYRHSLNVYRWWSISRNTDPNTGEIIIPKQALDIVKRIVDELDRARLICPTYGATYCVVGQLQYFVLNDPNGALQIRKGYQLAPSDPTVCFVAGLLDVEEEKTEESFDKLSRAVTLDGRFFPDAADMFLNKADRPDLAVALAGDDMSRLSFVADRLADMQEHKDTVEKVREKVIEILKQKCSQSDAPASALASYANILAKQNDPNAAIEYYGKALDLDYSQVQWRFTLAKLLAKTGRVSDAIQQAKICLRIRPQFKATADKFIADLSVLPGAENETSYAP